jgi:hypothetical protein
MPKRVITRQALAQSLGSWHLRGLSGSAFIPSLEDR